MMAQQRRAKGSGSVSTRVRKDGRSEARLTLPDGTRRSFYGSTREEAEAKLYKAKEQLAMGTLANPGRATVNDLWNDYAALNPDGIRRSSMSVRKSMVNKWVIPEIGRVRLSALSPVHIHQVIAKARDAEMASGSLANIYASLRALFKYAVQVDLIAVNPVDKVKPPKSGQQRELPITASSQIEALTNGIERSKYRGIMIVCIGDALRIGEARGLRWTDIDFANHIIKVRYQVEIVDGEVRFVPLKTASAHRDLPMPKFVEDALKRERREQNKRRLKLGPAWEDHDLVFSLKGRPLSRQTVANHLKRTCEAAGVPIVTSHHLRHLCATMLMAKNVHPRVVQAILGHASLAATMRYLHVVSDDLKNALGSLDSLIIDSSESGKEVVS